MKSLILLFLSLSLVSCSFIDTNRIAPGYTEAYKAIKLNIMGYDNEIDPDLVVNIPYASMIVSIGKGPSALMILESVNNDTYTWASADDVYLVIKNGKIIKTQGLPNNLMERLDPSEDWRIEDFQTEYSSYVSFRNPALNNLKVLSAYKMNAYQDEQLLFGTKSLRLIEEDIKSYSVAWFETNRYWLDKNNFVWKSSQHISPRLPPIHFEVTKKPL